MYRVSVTGLPAAQAGLAEGVLPNGGGAPRVGSARRRGARGLGGEKAAHKRPSGNGATLDGGCMVSVIAEGVFLALAQRVVTREIFVFVYPPAGS